jgi:triosephosphate isomerase (TIM)
MKRKVIAGNWKMNNDISETENLIHGILSKLENKKLPCDVIICPTFTSLNIANSLIKGTSIKLGAQNMYYEESGAYTGEISTKMLKSAGCEFVIVGHSERRMLFGETNELISKKVFSALKAGLKPIFCVGESLEERKGNLMNEIVGNQILKGLENISEENMKNIIIAYEPVWAIGTGINATPQQAEEAHKYIRGLIRDKYSEKTAEDLVIQYGGSVNPGNSKELLSQKDVDGALIGGASLKAESFVKIIESVE